MPFPVPGDWALPFPEQNAPGMYGGSVTQIPVRPEQEPWLNPTPDPWPDQLPQPKRGELPQNVGDMQFPLGPIPGKPNLLTDYNSLGNIRPFGPGEYVTNPDGTVSSERTWTVPVGNQWWVVPGMWLDNGTPTQVDPQTAAQYAQQSGLNWPTFDNENWANQYAKHRETILNRPGYGTGQLEPLWSRPWPPR